MSWATQCYIYRQRVGYLHAFDGWHTYAWGVLLRTGDLPKGYV